MAYSMGILVMTISYDYLPNISYDYQPLTALWHMNIGQYNFYMRGGAGGDDSAKLYKGYTNHCKTKLSQLSTKVLFPLKIYGDAWIKAQPQ